MDDPEAVGVFVSDRHQQTRTDRQLHKRGGKVPRHGQKESLTTGHYLLCSFAELPVDDVGLDNSGTVLPPIRGFSPKARAELGLRVREEPSPRRVRW